MYLTSGKVGESTYNPPNDAKMAIEKILRF